MRDGLFSEPPAPRALRDYQSAAIERLRASLASGHKRPVLMAPTGAGKTRIAAEVISLARAKNRRVAFCVDSLALVDQTVEAFSGEGIREVGVMQADHPMSDGSQPVQICSLQTVAKREFPECDLVMIDEAHTMREVVSRWMEAFPVLPFIGLTATPWAPAMGKRWDDLIIVATTKQLIEQGYLSDFRVFAPSHPDLSQVKTVGGDFVIDQLSQAMNKPDLVGDVVETWIKLGEDRPTVCFAVDRAHAQAIQHQFANSGIPCGYQDMNTSGGERAIIRDQFRSGRLKVVANVATLTKGVDWDVRCIILARPTKSEMLFVQMIGRGLRTADGKTDCRIIDHSDSHLRLGFVTDIHHASLDDGTVEAKEKQKREAKPSIPTECPKCHVLRPVRVHVCPSCGFAPTRQSTVQHAAGELEELRPKVKGKLVSDKTITLRGNEMPLSKFFGALKQYAAEKNYKPGWASQNYKKAVGVFPNSFRHVPPCEIPPEVKSWIIAQNIRFAKSRQNQRNDR